MTLSLILGLAVAFSSQGGAASPRPSDRQGELRRAALLIYDADQPNSDARKIARGVELLQRLTAAHDDIEALQMLRDGALSLSRFGPSEGRSRWLAEYEKATLRIARISTDEADILAGALLAAKEPKDVLTVADAHLRRFPLSREAPPILGDALFEAHAKGDAPDLERRTEALLKTLVDARDDRGLVTNWDPLLPLLARADCVVEASLGQDLAARRAAVEADPSSIPVHAGAIRAKLRDFKCRLRATQAPGR